MDVFLEMVISYLFLFLAFTTDLGEAQIGCDDPLPCGDHGPAIRFPFRLNSQPEHCGYPGFNLSCSDTNQTVLELPISVKLFVKKIDYKSQVIQLYDPDDCFVRQLRGLDLSSSPFQVEGENSYGYRDDYAVFNCSPRETEYFSYFSCLSGPSYQVYVDSMNGFITTTLISCTKIYTLRSIPDGIIWNDDKFLQLKWSTPACNHCEVKGKRCKLKNNTSETECGPKINKGIAFYPMNFPTLSCQHVQVWSILAYK
jgi:hypothetical protein